MEYEKKRERGSATSERSARLIVLIIYNKAAAEICPMENLIPKSYFLKLFTKMLKTHEFPMDFKHFFFVQIHFKKSNFIFVTRLRRNGRAAPFLSHVCSGFNIFFWASSFASIYQSRGARHIVRPKPIFVLYQNILQNPSDTQNLNDTYRIS